ncbi:MAG: alpha/beta hydrolase [Rhizobiales bacterium]|nr:alpha/beta hydrolase [Hyphomicrobiales bacterium]
MRFLTALLLLVTTAAQASEGGLLPGLTSAPLSVAVTLSGSKLSLDGFVIRPDRPGRFPLVVMVHGTPSLRGDAFFRELVKRSPVDFNTPAIAFAQRGYAAVTIMRRGFGRSDGAYAEDLRDDCDYLPAVRISGQDVLAALASLRREAWVDADHIVLLGHSTGGLAATAAAAENPAGVVAVLNFDGGRHSPSRSGQMCSPDSLVDTWAALGRVGRIPALWIYAENDRSYGPDLARRMFGAYSAGGAPAQLQVLPPFGSDGHDLITKASPENWLPAVAPFLAGLGLPVDPVITLPPPPDLPSPPGALPVCRKAFADYLAYRSDAKAFAMAARGGCGGGVGRTIDEARANALADCAANTRGAACRLYATGQRLAED